MTEDLATLVDRHVRRRAPLEKSAREAEWNLARTAEERWETESARLSAEIRRLLADRDVFARLSEIRDEHRPAAADLDRQLELLWLDHAANQADPALLAELAGFEARAESTYSSFRPTLDGAPTSENEIRRILRDENDVERRRRAWEASKALGPVVAPLVLDMVRLRNRIAAGRRARDFFAMDLARQEIDERFLFDVLERLEKLTDEPHRRLIERLGAQLGKRFGIRPEEIRPWHLADPFFQEAVAPEGLDLARFYAGVDLEALARKAFARMGFDVSKILARSDLYPRERKNQHAFCTHVDRTTDDVRVLCNLQSDDYWTDTILHELGHAVYSDGLDAQLPWRLREEAHILTTEAVALLFGRLASNPDWMIRVLGADEAAVEAIRGKLRENARTRQLLFPRWVLVMTSFERALYGGASGEELGRLWWDLVERFQRVRRPEDRAEPDWACKVHVALAPVYYHNYLLGDLMASQLDAWLTRELGTPFWFERTETARLLSTRLFREGARRPWNEALEHATGETLDPAHYVEQFVRERA
jgi:peptidyl-dipeptidase A